MINNEDIVCAFKILELRAKIFDLNLEQKDKKCDYYLKELKFLDCQLSLLFKSLSKYNFIDKIKTGNTLLVGEGNLSFTVSLIKELDLVPDIIASTYECYSEISECTKFNARILKRAGIKILHGIDAKELDELFVSNSFDTIIFQFPHSGTREGLNGVNANYILVKKFIISALQILKKNGVILITVVNSDFYNRMFRFDEIAQELGVNSLKKYTFNPKDYVEYDHTMTHQEESGIDDYSKFTTYEFKI